MEIEIDERTRQCSRCRQYRPIFEYRGLTETYEMTFYNNCAYCRRNNQLKDGHLVQVVIFRRDSTRGIQIMLSQRIHPDKPYFNMMQGTGGKVDVYTDNNGHEILETEEDTAMRETLEESGIILEEEKLQKIWSETVPLQLEWTARRCNVQDATYNVTLSIFIYPWDWIQEPIATESDKSSDWTWHTFQEVIFMYLIPMLQKNQDFIFQEIGKYFNYCEIESLDKQEENDISPLTEKEFNTFKKKTEKVTTKEIIAIEKYKKGVTLEINRLRGRLTRINKYLNNYYGRKYLQIFDFQDRNKVAEKVNCLPTLEEIRHNAPTEYSKIQNNVYRYTVHETGDKKNILCQLKIRTIKDYLNKDQACTATIDQLALSYSNYQLI
ncbi:hypothetical protein C2G38_2032040 [Gigaspora rosea]|uniref:Nudix hydrolase domain-containing protein n=1 Tax=Gigaspora rosea TaxID=44941 RepID=A0A397VQP9_9GLOM|nr:hypothetical protein C2G38_2032040 [Gigaspora rosea]